MTRLADMPVSEPRESGREDLNLRPYGPEPYALAKLSYAPIFFLKNSHPREFVNLGLCGVGRYFASATCGTEASAVAAAPSGTGAPLPAACCGAVASWFR